jgi:dTDP-4-dehydrorhamnose 3,5-epimerase
MSFESVIELSSGVFKDSRGTFRRLFDLSILNEVLRNNQQDLFEVVQINFATNLAKGTFRGLHFQTGDHAERKFVKVLNGEIIDIIVDIRPNSDTYLQSKTYRLRSDKNNAVLVPRGFAHGYLTLSENVDVFYAVDKYYEPDAESGLNIADPKLKLDFSGAISVISEKDMNWPHLI